MLKKINLVLLSFNLLATNLLASDSSKTTSDSLKITFDSGVNAIFTVWTIGKDIHGFIPNKEVQQELEQRKIEFAEQRKIVKAREAFFQCYADNNNGLNVDRFPNGLPTNCQNVAIALMALGCGCEVETSIAFFNRFRENKNA